VADLIFDGDQLVVRLSWWERIVALHGNVRVPLSSVTSVDVEARSKDVLRRFWHPPTGPEFLVAPYGVRSYGGGKGFVAAPRRRPAVLVRLDPPSHYAGLLVSVADPKATAESIMDAARRARRHPAS
jgi:hypothetical protein